MMYLDITYKHKFVQSLMPVQYSVFHFIIYIFVDSSLFYIGPTRTRLYLSQTMDMSHIIMNHNLIILIHILHSPLYPLVNVHCHDRE